MSPRALRSAIKSGQMTSADPRIYRGRTPAPPPEWPEWRRERMKVAVRAAILFLQGKLWQEISKYLEQEGLLEMERTQRRGAVVTKQRVAQYVDKGIQFLLDRNCFVPVKNSNAR